MADIDIEAFIWCKQR